MFSLNIAGQLRIYDKPAIMGIINATPDSFYSASRATGEAEIARRAESMAADGADFIDVGGCSTRPGAAQPSLDEEWARLLPALKAVRSAAPGIPVSVDTYRAEIARRAIEGGLADIINDVGGTLLDKDMEATVIALHVPYILMHMRGTPESMTSCTEYPQGVVAAVISELQTVLDRLTLAGAADILVDPGFGFAKTVEQNYRLLSELPAIAKALGRPILVGLSRKSVATTPLGINSEDALPATVALNMAALERGAAVLRVHDVAAARQAIAIHSNLTNLLP